MRKVILILVVACLFFSMIIWFMTKNTMNHDETKKDIKKIYRQQLGNDPNDFIVKKLMKEESSFINKFILNVKKSKELTKNETILFIGLIRNHGKKSIDFWFPILEELGKQFKDYAVVFVENDSVDDTREQLLSLSRTNPHYFLYCPKDQSWNSTNCRMGRTSIQNRQDKHYPSKLKKRLDMLTFLRESYLTQIKNLKNVDHVMMVDWDLKGDFSKEGFYHALSVLRADPSIDGVASNSFLSRFGMMMLYDPFPLHSNKNCKQKNLFQYQIKDMSARLKHESFFKNSTSIIGLPSAFGGVCLYRFKSLVEKDPHYEKEGRCPFRCEHSVFHENLNIVLDPWFVFFITENMH